MKFRNPNRPVESLARSLRRNGTLLISILCVVWLAAVPVTAEETMPEYPEPGEQTELHLQVNINTDNAATLAELLDGVGPTRAEAIVAHRETHGHFDTAEDLLAVTGIGPATLSSNLDRVVTEVDDMAAE